LDEGRSASSDEDNEERFNVNLEWIKENDSLTTELVGIGIYERIQNMTDEEWEELGSDIANNTHLESLQFTDGALDDNKMSFLFRGLTRSSAINEMSLYGKRLSVDGLRSMLPFLQNSNNLRFLDLYGKIKGLSINTEQ
jgi:hypothetical protein